MVPRGNIAKNSALHIVVRIACLGSANTYNLFGNPVFRTSETDSRYHGENMYRLHASQLGP